MPAHHRAVPIRSFEAVEQAPGQYEHIIHTDTGPYGSVHAIGQAPDVLARLREFLGPVPVHEDGIDDLTLLGAHVLAGNVIGVDWTWTHHPDHHDDKWIGSLRFHLADGRVIAITGNDDDCRPGPLLDTYPDRATADQHTPRA